jgi:hypothetical protein
MKDEIMYFFELKDLSLFWWKRIFLFFRVIFYLIPTLFDIIILEELILPFNFRGKGDVKRTLNFLFISIESFYKYSIQIYSNCIREYFIFVK